MCRASLTPHLLHFALLEVKMRQTFVMEDSRELSSSVCCKDATTALASAAVDVAAELAVMSVEDAL